MSGFVELKSMLSESIGGIRLLENESMAKYTSFRIGGVSPLMILPKSGEEAKRAISLLKASELPYVVAGRGTNLLIEEGRLEFAVLRLAEDFAGIRLVSQDTIEADSGAGLGAISVFAMKNGLSGLEFAQGIPGTLGGGVYMNAGAYGAELKDSLVSALCCAEGIKTVGAEALELGYRKSALMKNGETVLGARLRLRPAPEKEIAARMEELSRKRREKQPLEFPSAGSTFKRPAGGFAAALIDEAGLKGLRVGGACVSEKHAGFIVSDNNASFGDVIELMQTVRERVSQSSGILLEPEVRIIRRDGAPWIF